MASHALKTLSQLQPGVQVQLPGDPRVWEIVSVSGTTARTPATAKWCWLRQGTNTYKRVTGSAQLRLLRLVEQEDR